METIILTFVSVLLVSLVSLVGIFLLFLKKRTLEELNFLLVSLAVGSLLGGAFFHLLPDVFRNENANIAAFVLLGIFAFFALEKILHWHHSHEAHAIKENEEKIICENCNENIETKGDKKHLGSMVIFSDALHNFLDGALIAISFLTSPAAGVATTISVFLHEIPQEVGDFGVLLHSGFSKGKAMLYNFLSALTALLGASLVFVNKSISDSAMPYLTAFAAGSLLYIAMADLVPELHKQEKSKFILLQFVFIFIGIILMYGLLYLE